MKGKSYEHFKEEAKQYKRILLDYKKTGKVFVDPNFHPTAHIVERKIGIDDSMESWVRIDEICDVPLFKKDLISPDFVCQGEIGDCYFLAALSRIAQQPELVPNLFNRDTANYILPKIPHSINLKCGAVVVYFHCFGRKTPVLIDTLLPIKYGQLRFSKPSDNTKSPWFCLVEKAYAKLNDSYSDIVGGTLPNAIYNLFGYYPTNKTFKNFDKEKLDKMPLFDRIMKYQKHHAVMGTSIDLSDNENGVTEDELEKKGLIKGHCYLIQKVRIHANKKFFCLRNPWGKHEWNGDWCDDSPLWTPELKEGLGWKKEDDGTFWMNDTDYFRYFTEVEVSKPIPPEWYSRRFFVQLKPGDHDGYDVESEKSKMMERPNFAFQVTDPIPKGENCRFHILVEKRHKLFNEKEMCEFQPPKYCVYLAHAGGKKLDPKNLPYCKRYQLTSQLKTFSFHYDVFGNDDIVTIALNRMVKCDLVEDCYVLVYCPMNFKLYDIDKPDELFPDEYNGGFMFNNFSVKHPKVAPPLKPGKVKDGEDAIVLGDLTKTAFDSKRQRDLERQNKKIERKIKKLADEDVDEDDELLDTLTTSSKPKIDPSKSKSKSKVTIETPTPKPKPKDDDDKDKDKDKDDLSKSKSKVKIDKPKPKDDDDDKDDLSKSKSKVKIDKPKSKDDDDDKDDLSKSKSKVKIDKPKSKDDDDDDKIKDDLSKSKSKVKIDKPKPKDDDDKDKDDLINKLKKENDELKEELNQMKEKLESTKGEVESGNNIRKKLRARLRKEQEEKEKAVNAFKELEEKIKNTKENKDQEITDAKIELDEMQDQLNKATKEADKAKNSLKAKENELSNAKKETSEIRSKLNKITEEKNRIEKEKQDEIDKLKQEIEKLKKQKVNKRTTSSGGEDEDDDEYYDDDTKISSSILTTSEYVNIHPDSESSGTTNSDDKLSDDDDDNDDKSDKKDDSSDEIEDKSVSEHSYDDDDDDDDDDEIKNTSDDKVHHSDSDSKSDDVKVHSIRPPIVKPDPKKRPNLKKFLPKLKSIKSSSKF